MPSVLIALGIQRKSAPICDGKPLALFWNGGDIKVFIYDSSYLEAILSHRIFLDAWPSPAGCLVFLLYQRKICEGGGGRLDETKISSGAVLPLGGARRSVFSSLAADLPGAWRSWRYTRTIEQAAWGSAGTTSRLDRAAFFFPIPRTGWADLPR